MIPDRPISTFDDRRAIPRRVAAGVRAIFWHLFLAGCLLQLSISPCAAASQSDWDACTSQDSSRNIPACTRIIDDAGTSDADRVDAYLWRAGDYVAQNSLDSAIRDYSSAIRINPRNMTALSGRAIANFRKGDRDQAILDYSIARRFNSPQLDTLVANSDDLKEIARIAAQSPVPQAQLDAAVDRMIPKPPTCQTGYRLQGSTCVAISCPTGQRLDGNSCTPIVCGAGQELSGNSCIAVITTKYLALALGQTNHLGYGSSWDKATMDLATDDAMQRCRNEIPGGNCKIILSAANACISLSWTPTGTGWGAATRPIRSEAVSAAVASCKKANPRGKCVSAGSWCNTT